MTTAGLENRELFNAINRSLPNIATYVRTVLKREKLTEDAEAYRQRYEVILNSLEQGILPQRPMSFLGDDDSGYFSANRQRVGDIAEQPRVPSPITQTGYLLRRDDKFRWHRSWCRLESREMRFYIYDESNEEVLVKSFPLENISTRFGPQPIADCDKENCFVICGVGGETLQNGATEPEATGTPATTPGGDEVCFAAYSDAEYNRWKEVLHLVTTSSRESGSLSLMDSSQWLTPAAHDSTSSSSNFSSNRESMISTSSSLLNNYRMSTRSDTADREHLLVDDLKIAKQQQPLPSPPPAPPPHQNQQHQQVPQQEDMIPCDDDDNASGGTIYESIDNLVLQFNETMRETAQAMDQIGQSMKSSGKKRKKKDRSLFKQHSFLSRRSTKSKILDERKALLERGERYSGYLWKRNTNGSWKKKWCVLKGCILGYYKSPDDSHGREYVILDGEIHMTQDQKRSFTFCVCCKGVSEIHFAAEDEESFTEWLSRLNAVSKAYGDFGETWASWQEEEQQNAEKFANGGDSIYNTPRPLSTDGTSFDVPSHFPPPPLQRQLTAEGAIDAGLYSAPRALLQLSQPEETAPQSFITSQGLHFYTSGNPFDTYDIPRASMSPIDPDEEGIYDDPLDLMDMEIYDYPPDALELAGLIDSGLEMNESTRNSMFSDIAPTERSDRSSSSTLDESWKTMSLPHHFGSSRPSMAFSTVSSADEYQSSRNSIMSNEGVYDYPRSIQQSHQSFISHTSSESTPPPPPPIENLHPQPLPPAPPSLTISMETDSAQPPQQVLETSLEFGQCSMRGVLHKKERFSSWAKLHCIIRNNFLECHKTHGTGFSPVLKLFLPGSEVKEGGGDLKKKWAFQVKHPRREGVLVFAADSREDCSRWMRAFQSGSSIEVQSVSTVEQIRITDLDMQKRWASVDTPTTEIVPTFSPSPSVTPTVPLGPDEFGGAMPRRQTFSGTTTHSRKQKQQQPPQQHEEYQSETLKRRRKFSWVKSGLLRKHKSDKKHATSVPELNPSRQSNASMDFNIPIDIPIIQPAAPAQRDSLTLRKSVSLELLPANDSEGSSLGTPTLPDAHHASSIGDPDQFAGYLRVQRRGADNMWVRYWCVLEKFIISCFISQRDLTLALSIQLKGSRIAEAAHESHREFSFKVLHLESGQCLYFAADDVSEFQRWFTQIVKGAEQTILEETEISGPFVGYYYHPKESNLKHHSSNPTLATITHQPSTAAEDIFSGKGRGSNIAGSAHQPIPGSNSVFYRGKLKKSSHTGKWKDRYCVIKTGGLHIYRNPLEKVPITSIPLYGCSIELVSVPRDSQFQFLFKLNPSSAGKSHTFAAPNETEMYAWVSALRDASSEKQAASGNCGDGVGDVVKQEAVKNGGGTGSGNNSPSLSGKSSTLKRKAKSKLKDADLVSYVPATSLKHPDLSGLVEVQYATEPWLFYWCVAHSDCLYIYQNETSQSTVRTVVLPGYEVKQGDPQITKRALTISLGHTGISPVYLSYSNHADYNQWLSVLEKYARAEGVNKQQSKKVSSTKVLLHVDDTSKGLVVPQKVSSSSVAGGAKKKGPMKADHSIISAAFKEAGSFSSDSSPASTTKTIEPPLNQDGIIKRYEKRIRKTRRVANQTEERLKMQQTALLHFKKELSRHVLKLQEIGNDPEAQKRLKEIRHKLQQVDKIVPYLGKYITVNRQAEMQTVAVLKETCTMELQKMSRSPSKETFRSPKASSTPAASKSGTSKKSMEMLKDSHSTVDGSSGSELNILREESIPEEQEEVEEESSTTTTTTTTTTASQLVTSQSAAQQQKEVAATLVSAAVYEKENPYASLSELKKPSSNGVVPTKPRSNYAQLDFSQIPAVGALRPPSVKYAEVQIGPFGRGKIVEESLVPGPSISTKLSSVTESSVNRSSEDIQDVTLTPENAVLSSSSFSTLSVPKKQSISPSPPPTSAPPPPPTEAPPPPPPPPAAEDFTHTPPLSPIVSNHHSPSSPQHTLSSTPSNTTKSPSPSTSTTVLSTGTVDTSKSKSPPPPVARKPSGKQSSTPTHRRPASQELLGHRMSSGSDVVVNGSGSGLESSLSDSSSRVSGDFTSPKHECLSIIEGAPSLMDRIKALQAK